MKFKKGDFVKIDGEYGVIFDVMLDKYIIAYFDDLTDDNLKAESLRLKFLNINNKSLEKIDENTIKISLRLKLFMETLVENEI